MLGAEMEGHCGINSWTHNSRIFQTQATDAIVRTLLEERGKWKEGAPQDERHFARLRRRRGHWAPAHPLGPRAARASACSHGHT